MPKELTHLIVAEASKKTFSSRHPDTLLNGCLMRHRDVFRFGAVMHDVAFCASSSKRGQAVKEKGFDVHGTPPNDTLRPFKYLGSEYDKTGDAEILAMISGAVTHMLADVAFHPFVYYYTGDNLSRHYRLETLIDTYVAGRQGSWLDSPVSTRGFYRHLKGKYDFLIGHLCGFLGLSDVHQPEIAKALNMHAFALKLFRSRVGFHLFRLTTLWGSQDYKSKTNLFYPSGMRFEAPFFQSDFVYHHPVTGVSETVNVETLVERAVQNVCVMFEAIQEAAKDRSLETYFSGLLPVSLETGLDPFMGKPHHYTDVSTSIDQLVSGR